MSNTIENKKINQPQEETKPLVSVSKLLEAGVYFGHKKEKWNPKMAPFIHGVKNGTHIIDVSKTSKALEVAYKLINKMAEKGASFIFVGTKKQAKEVIQEQAIRTNSAYVNERWLGGTLTNSKTIFSRVRAMEDLENLEQRNFEGYTKKEGILMKKELDKLHKNLNGIRNMQRAPQFMIIADPNEDMIAIKEAKKRNVKIIGIIDTNTNPDLVDLGIPANDDSLKSLNLIITILADAIIAAKGGTLKYAYQPDSAIELPVDAQAQANRETRNNRFQNNRRNFENNRPYKNNFSKDKEEKKIENK